MFHSVWYKRNISWLMKFIQGGGRLRLGQDVTELAPEGQAAVHLHQGRACQFTDPRRPLELGSGTLFVQSGVFI